MEFKREDSERNNMADLSELHEPLRKSSSLKKHQNNLHENHKAYLDHQRHPGQIRMPRRHNNKCFRYLTGVLHCYNVFLLVIGSGVLGVGLWLLVKDYSSREISAIVHSHYFEVLSYALTAGGGAVAILAFCGCCGTMKRDRFVLCFYGTVLLFVLLLLLAGCVMGLIFRNTVDMGIKEVFKTTVERQYGIDINRNADNRLVTDAWDAMQRTLHCCGPYGNEDSITSWAFYKLSSDWHKRPGANSYPYVPKSCCVDGMSLVDCQGIKNLYKGYPAYGPPLRTGEDRNPALYKEGCLDKAIDYLRQHSLYIAITAGVVPVVLIVGVCMSCFLCLTVRNDDDDDDDDEFEEADV